MPDAVRGIRLTLGPSGPPAGRPRFALARRAGPPAPPRGPAVDHNGRMSRLLSDDEVTTQLGDLPGWQRDGDAIVATVEAPDFPAAIRIVDAVADEAEQMNHHPDIDIRWRTTRWLLSTHDAGGLTQLDIELAHRISAAARAEGATLGG